MSHRIETSTKLKKVVQAVINDHCPHLKLSIHVQEMPNANVVIFVGGGGEVLEQLVSILNVCGLLRFD